MSCRSSQKVAASLLALKELVIISLAERMETMDKEHRDVLGSVDKQFEIFK